MAGQSQIWRVGAWVPAVLRTVLCSALVLVLNDCLTCQAIGGIWQGLQPRGLDGGAAAQTAAIAMPIQTLDGGIDLGKQIVAIGNQRQVALPAEDVCRLVSHMVADALPVRLALVFLHQCVALDQQAPSLVMQSGADHVVVMCHARYFRSHMLTAHTEHYTTSDRG